MKNKVSNEQKKETSLISQIEQIAKMAKNSKMNFNYNLEDEFALWALNDFLGCETIQSIIFSIIFQLSFKKEDLNLNEIAKYINCSPIRMIDNYQDIDQLKKLKLILTRNSNSYFGGINYQEYFIPSRVTEAIGMMDKNHLQETEKMELIPLLDKIYQKINERDQGNLTRNELILEVYCLLEYNWELKFIKKLDDMNLSDDELLLYLYACRETLNDEGTIDLIWACNKIWADTASRFEMKRNLVKGTSNLIKRDLIKLQDGMFKSDREILLTEKSLNLLLEEDANLILLNEKKVLGLIENKDIKKQKLFFNQKEQDHLDELSGILQQENFTKIQSRLKENSMPFGIAILFHGLPGTGKTAATYHIASNAGRDIIMVDISDTKSLWFGESEKKIKAVFTDYKKLLQKNQPAPVLVFNEADAVFGKRGDVDRSAVGQTENSIQNVILQEMENFEGILIATTNLTFNFDKAFERRFLYKIEFNKPGVTTRTNIWMDKIPGLTNEQAGILASRFDITGGNIENVSRKVLMTSILQGQKPDIKFLIQYCEQETLVNENRRKIGF